MIVAVWLLVCAIVLLAGVLDHGLTEVARAIYRLNTQETAAESRREES